MGELLKIGQKIFSTELGSTITVTEFLGGGGQGEVYRVSIGENSYALKWYFDHTANSEQKAFLERLIMIGPPNNKFLWPIQIIVNKKINGFGYLMNVRQSRYRSIVELMKRQIEPSFRAIATAAFELSDSFYRLHSKGMCYRDISFGNVFFDPISGEVLICDNDNITVDDQNIELGILGTPRFMAPEIVRGEVKPSTKTDLFSLAVLLFYMFIMHHPLEGKREVSINCLDLPAMNKLYGTEPIFIFDPNNDSNRPISGYHDNAIELWPIYPAFLQELFIRSFTDGIDDSNNGRVRESEWRIAMIKLRDTISYCSCGAENFHDLNLMEDLKGKYPKCWSCNKEVEHAPSIKINQNRVMLNYNTRLYPHHIDTDREYDFTEPVAKVVQHPKYPEIWGLKNLTKNKWIITSKSNAVTEADIDKAVTICDGTVINFGKLTGEIKV